MTNNEARALVAAQGTQLAGINEQIVALQTLSDKWEDERQICWALFPENNEEADSGSVLRVNDLQGYIDTLASRILPE